MRVNSIFRDWASMARLPNVPTVWSNVFTAWVLAWWTGSPDDPWNVIRRWWSDAPDRGWDGWIRRDELKLHGDVEWLLLGATLIYAGGAIFSEVCDVAFDRKFRPERPLPNGRIPRWLAAAVGLGFCLVGGVYMMSGAVGHLHNDDSFVQAENRWQVAMLLGVVLSYAILHKRSPWLAIPLMGLCRPILVLACFYAWLTVEIPGGEYPGEGIVTVLSGLNWSYMVVLGLYVAGISWMALGEAKVWRRKAVGMMLAGLPLVDAVFLVLTAGVQWTLVPLGCMALAIGLRKVAAAT